MSRSDLELLNLSINKENPVMEQKLLSTSIIDKPYLLVNISSINTKYGKCILTTLAEDSNGDVLFKCWLPKRVTNSISDELIEKMNKSDSKYSLTYLGKSVMKNSNIQSRSLLKFDILV
jgi:hypothetical protein